MSLTRHAQINRHLGTLQVIEFASEYLLNFRGQPTERQLCGLLAIFELIKLKLRFDKWRAQRNPYIYISENNAVETIEMEEEDRAIKFAQEWSQKEEIKDVDMKAQLQVALSQLKKEKPKFNIGYQEVLNKSNLKMGVITTLPIPEQLKRSLSSRPSNRNLKVWVGEMIFLVRPLVHCIFLYMYGSQSYKPYLTSLMMDLLRCRYTKYDRLILQKDVDYFRRCEKAEMKIRFNDMLMCYALRNPFYQRVMKARVLEPVLGLVFKEKSRITKFIIQLIEIRTSVSLLL